MSTVAYVRVSAVDQNLDRQLDIIKQKGITYNKLFQDSCSGRSRERPGLKQCLAYLREGDELVVTSIDRMARNLFDLQQMVNTLLEKDVSIRFIKEGMVFGDSASAGDKLMLQMMGAFAEFERTLINERRTQGIRSAMERGKRTGPKIKLSDRIQQELRARYEAGEQATKLAREYGISRSTLYVYIGPSTGG